MSRANLAVRLLLLAIFAVSCTTTQGFNPTRPRRSMHVAPAHSTDQFQPRGNPTRPRRSMHFAPAHSTNQLLNPLDHVYHTKSLEAKPRYTRTTVQQLIPAFNVLLAAIDQVFEGSVAQPLVAQIDEVISEALGKVEEIAAEVEVGRAAAW